MKKLLSYFWPQTEKVLSDYSGLLEITWYNGKKYLDSSNANYSYGFSQKVLEYGLTKLNIKCIKCILLLGLGGGSVIRSLRNRFQFKGKIQAVEIDEKIISIAESEFGISHSEYLDIYHGDALEFVLETTNIYDLVIVDLFIDTSVPAQFYSHSFAEALNKICGAKGSAIFNMGVKHVSPKILDPLIDYFKHQKKWDVQLYKQVKRKNTLLVLKG